MFGHEKKQLTGIVRNIRTSTVVRGGGAMGPNGGGVNVRSIEVLTFSLVRVAEEAESEETAIELVGKKNYFRSLPVEEGDEVQVEGIWKPRVATLSATRLINRTRGITTSGRRFA